MNFYPSAEQQVYYDASSVVGVYPQSFDMNVQQFAQFPQAQQVPQMQPVPQMQLNQAQVSASAQQANFDLSQQNLNDQYYYHQSLNVQQQQQQMFFQQQLAAQQQQQQQQQQLQFQNSQQTQMSFPQQDFFYTSSVNNGSISSFDSVNSMSVPNLFSLQYNDGNLPNSSVSTIDSMNEIPKSPLSPISDISLPLESMEPEHKELMSSPVKLASQKFMLGGANSISYNKLQLPSPIDDFQYNNPAMNLTYNALRKNSAPLPYKIAKRKSSTLSMNCQRRRHSSIKSDHTSQPGPIPASPPELVIDPMTGDETLTFFYSKQKIITKFTLKCPKKDQEDLYMNLPSKFLTDNCIYPRAMVPVEEYKGNRGPYERECNKLGWQLSWLNPDIRNQRGLIQRAVDSWRNTRSDFKIRSRRVRKQAKLSKKQQQQQQQLLVTGSIELGNL